MQFKLLALATTVLSATQASAALTAAQVVGNIKYVTQLSANANADATGISASNGPDSIPRAIQDFKAIVTAVTQDVAAMEDTHKTRRQAATSGTSFSAQEQNDICSAFRDFVTVHQQLLSTVIGKQSLFARYYYSAPMASILRSLEGGVDTLAYGIVDVVPTCARGAQSDKSKLDAALDQAIAKYQG
ncbi:hypothetical protein GGR56DRAFT_672683 [Xylariaceae sp. FL0804]|nr:hypothetical protein GGR56DRAFT_672683 [Xylariaceae sp. FL0804]